MALVDVMIGRRSYQLACGRGEEAKVKALADQVNERIAALGDLPEETGESMILAMVALTMQDAINEAERTREEQDDQALTLDVAVEKSGEKLDKKALREQQKREEAFRGALDKIASYIDSVADRLEKV